jgi:hypothetical protein
MRELTALIRFRWNNAGAPSGGGSLQGTAARNTERERLLVGALCVSAAPEARRSGPRDARGCCLFSGIWNSNSRSDVLLHAA